MEEAEVLCDRLGIFVDGGFQCIGNSTEVTYIFTSMKHITTFGVPFLLYSTLTIISAAMFCSLKQDMVEPTCSQ
jgi:hypothetical protein